jgi:hypothetical protein
LHPLHKSFLHFFTAICYESLGWAAHNYSSNKLPFLNLAQQAFASAKNTLPLPYLSNEKGVYYSPAISPTLINIECGVSVDTSQIVSTTPLSESPTPAPLFAIRTHPSTVSSTYSQDGIRPSSSDVPSFDDYSPQPFIGINFMPLVEPFCEMSITEDLELCMSMKLDTPKRQSDLAPKPLSIQKKPTSVDPITPQRPLPPIPRRSALRRVHRQTALQVQPLVNRYESLSHSHHTPEPTTSLQPTINLLRLVRYNANLSSFRTQLSQHITSVSDTITKATALQKEHKAKQSKQLASYWMLKPAAEGAVAANNLKAAEKKERIERLRQNGWRVNKERFGWKGEDYYRELRRRAEVELRGWE